MQKSFVVKSTLCIEECQFYLRTGDLLVYDPSHQRLTVYRNGEITKVLSQTPLSVAGMVKTNILAEVQTPSPAPPAPVEASAPATKADAPKPQKKALATPAPKKQEVKKAVVSSEEEPTVTISEATI